MPVLFVGFIGCGKNEAVRGVPTGGYPPVGQGGPYYPQAPVPPNGGYQLPPNYAPPTSGPNPYFYPQMPQGMPNQYTPWLPIDNYFRRYPQTTNIYINIMVDWNQYANYYGHNQYDFNRFWFDFCPTYYPQYQQVWNYFDQNVYWWTDYNTSYQCEDPYSFWSYYQGLPYDYVDTSCGGWCF